MMVRMATSSGGEEEEEKEVEEDGDEQDMDVTQLQRSFNDKMDDPDWDNDNGEEDNERTDNNEERGLEMEADAEDDDSMGQEYEPIDPDVEAPVDAAAAEQNQIPQYIVSKYIYSFNCIYFTCIGRRTDSSYTE